MPGQRYELQWPGPRLSQWESHYSRWSLRVRSFTVGIRLVCYDRRCLHKAYGSFASLAGSTVFFIDVRHVCLRNMGNLFSRSSVLQFSQLPHCSWQCTHIDGLLLPFMCGCPFLSLDGVDTGCLRSRSPVECRTKRLTLSLQDYLQDICVSSRTDVTFNPYQNWTKQFHSFNFARSRSLFSHYSFLFLFSKRKRPQIRLVLVSLFFFVASLRRSSKHLVCRSCIHSLSKSDTLWYMSVRSDWMFSSRIHVITLFLFSILGSQWIISILVNPQRNAHRPI